MGIESEHVQAPGPAPRVRTEPRLLLALPDLIVVVVERHDRVLEPDVGILLDEERVSGNRSKYAAGSR